MDIAATIMSFPWQTAFDLVLPLAAFIAGIVAYSVLIFRMEKFISERDIFGRSAHYRKFADSIPYWSEEGTLGRKVRYFLKYVLFFPIVVFVYFAFFFLLLLFMTKKPDAGSLMLMAMGVVGSVRVISYYSEDLSQEVAKLFPLTLLVIYLIEIFPFDVSASAMSVLGAMADPAVWALFAHYFAFIILLEFTMRILHWLYESVARAGRGAEALGD